MILLAHRGLWTNPREQNTIKALNSAIEKGYGIETDIWTNYPYAAVSHDYPDPEAPMLSTIKLEGTHPVALNIKSSGLETCLSLPTNPNIFLFDGSVPDSLKLIKAGYKVFTRHSEYEKNPSFYELASGVWVDCFKKEWVTQDIIKQHQRADKQVALVSPELHGRDYASLWKLLIHMNHQDIMLCTDHPELADKYFNGVRYE